MLASTCAPLAHGRSANPPFSAWRPSSASQVKRFRLVTIVLLVVACADQSATQYVGSVMQESAPESEGSLRLTFFSRTDTSFSGVIELGAPAHGTGSAYGWQEGRELRVVSVGAHTGDTIVWTSRMTGAELGGRFEITGGKRTGEEGTWRARLVKGPPATAATLRSPQRPSLPPLTASWPILLLLVTAAVLSRWIRRSPSRPAADGTPGLAPTAAPSGIGGWLLLFTIGQLLGIAIWFVRLRETWVEHVDGMGVGAAMTGMQSLLVLESATYLLALPVVLGGLVLMARRSSYAPRYWFAYLVVSGAYLLVDVLATPFVVSQMERLVGAEAVEEVGVAGTMREQIRQLGFTLVWALYWARSRRVRATFGAAALDPTARAPESAGHLPPLAPGVPGAGDSATPVSAPPRPSVEGAS